MAAGLDRYIAQLRESPDTRDLIMAWRSSPARAAAHACLDVEISQPLLAALRRAGIHSLYTHQAKAISSALLGENVAMVSPTASGKSLCFQVPVLQSMLQDDSACAMFVFPTKALAHDQLASFKRLADLVGKSNCSCAYDGDTPTSQRPTIRRSANVIVTNPDMLHVSILPNHTLWDRFMRNLRYVIIDEMHSYRGVFGGHVANVLRRLWRVARFYGSTPQFISASATIANPAELAQALANAPVRVIRANGAPRGERITALLNPPVVDERLGLRRPLLDQVRDIANGLLREDIQTVVFCQSRRAVERLVVLLRQDARKEGRDPEEVRGYRGGYLAEERRLIERELREGTVRAIVATNALELGIDIGGLDACVMAGYPGTIAATWQRAGRAGRGTGRSLAIMVASDAPSDQYIASHPNYLFGQPVERALIHPDNLYLLIDHLRCAVAELPLTGRESFGGLDTGALLSYLQDEGQVRLSRDRWVWTGAPSPARDMSLRSASPDHVTIMLEHGSGPSRILGTIDREAAPLWVHEGAIYMHEGVQHLITSLDWPTGIAVAERHQADYYTEASQNRKIEIVDTLATTNSTSLGLARGDIRLTRSVNRYRRIDLHSHAEVGWGIVDIPDQESYNQACWFTVPEAIVDRLEEQGSWTGQRRYDRGPNWAQQRNRARERDHHRCTNCGVPEPSRRQHEVHHVVPFGTFGWRPGLNENYRQANALDNLVTLCPACHRLAERQVAVSSSLAGLSRVMGHVIPLLFMCDRHDVGLHADVDCPDTGLPTVFCFDAVPGGVGLSDQVMDGALDILARAAELVRDCRCECGCPSCIGSAITPNPHAKNEVIRLAQSLCQDARFRSA